MTYQSKIFVTVDLVILKRRAEDIEVLFIQRRNPPFQYSWALPGGFVDENEDLLAAAQRELLEETSVKVADLQQIGAFGAPHRDPRGHMVSVAYFAEVPLETQATAGDDAQNTQWMSIKSLPKLAFDHQQILNEALRRFIEQ